MTPAPTGLLVAAGVSVATAVTMAAVIRAVAGTPRPGWSSLRRAPATWWWPVGMLLLALPTFALLAPGFSPTHLPALLLVMFGVPAAAIDARELRLPNELTYGLAATATAAVGILTAVGVPGSLPRALLCGVGYAAALLGIAVFTPTGRPRSPQAGSVAASSVTALGWGDIKLAAGLGVVLGWTSLPALTAAIAFTAVTHLLWVLCCAAARRAGRSSGMSGTALGPWMVLGAMVALYLAVGSR